jgi:HSP20 family protein
MRVSRWQAFSPVWNQLHQFQDEMNRLFDRWNGGTPVFSPSGFPALNVWEDGESIFVEAELPGLDLKDLEIYVSGGNQLTIKGERKPCGPENGAWHRQERVFGAFSRTLALPFAVDAEKVEARLENGVLHLQLTKHESARPRKIPVKAE